MIKRPRRIVKPREIVQKPVPAQIKRPATPSKCKLIVDTRERNVLIHTKEFDEIPHEVKQITVGDYALQSDDKLLAIIERKSLDDFAASLKDGRHDNREKMFQLREATNCRILYIIEGPEFPAPDDKFQGISYYVIESSIFHMMIRDGVSIIRTKDSLDTAKMLMRFMRAMDTLMGKNEPFWRMGAAEADPQIRDLLTQKYVKSDHDIVREMWCKFRGISAETADVYIAAWTLKDIICAKIDQADIDNHKLASGRKIGKRVANSLSAIDRCTQCKLITCVPGISAAVAEQIVAYERLPKLLDLPVETIESIKIGKKQTNLGPKRTGDILRLFNYKFTRE